MGVLGFHHPWPECVLGGWSVTCGWISVPLLLFKYLFIFGCGGSSWLRELSLAVVSSLVAEHGL